MAQWTLRTLREDVQLLLLTSLQYVLSLSCSMDSHTYKASLNSSTYHAFRDFASPVPLELPTLLGLDKVLLEVRTRLFCIFVSPVPKNRSWHTVVNQNVFDEPIETSYL